MKKHEYKLIRALKVGSNSLYIFGMYEQRSFIVCRKEFFACLKYNIVARIKTRLLIKGS